MIIVIIIIDIIIIVIITWWRDDYCPNKDLNPQPVDPGHVTPLCAPVGPPLPRHEPSPTTKSRDRKFNLSGNHGRDRRIDEWKAFPGWHIL